MNKSQVKGCVKNKVVITDYDLFYMHFNTCSRPVLNINDKELYCPLYM